MRLFLSAALLAALSVSANAAEIRVLAPGFVYNAALKDLAADFTKKTGVNVIVNEGGMNVIVGQIKTATPPAGFRRSAPASPSPTPGSATTTPSATSPPDQYGHARLPLAAHFLPPLRRPPCTRSSCTT